MKTNLSKRHGYHRVPWQHEAQQHEEDDSDRELKQAVRVEVERDQITVPSKRKVGRKGLTKKRLPGKVQAEGRLRQLLDLRPADDFIETRQGVYGVQATVAYATSSSRPPQASVDGDNSDPELNQPVCQEPESVERDGSDPDLEPQQLQIKSPNQHASQEQQSSEEEVVLSLASRSRRQTTMPTKKTNAAPTAQPDLAYRHPNQITVKQPSSVPVLDDSDETSDDVEYSLAMNQSYRLAQRSSPTAVSIATTAPDEISDISADDQELVLATRPTSKQSASSSLTPATFIAPYSSALATTPTKHPVPTPNDIMSLQGQRPSFPASHQQLKMGPHRLDDQHHIPAPINRFLRSYQRQGVEFLFKAYMQGRGGLLGDDMGLGKTIQVISFLSAIMKKTATETDAERRIEAVRNDRQDPGYHQANATWPTCLILCPSSVIDNWRNELDTWGYFEHAAFVGSRAKEALEMFRRGRLDILITSHETAAFHIAQLCDLDLSCIFIDEAQKLKNPNSQMTKAMHQFHCRARFALTGTAIQNSYRELYTIADWTNPRLLGSVKEWINEIEEPLKRGQKKGASEEYLADARTRAEKLVQNVLPLFFLRRTKALIQDQLPHKFDKVVFCPLTATQLDAYKRILAEPEVDHMARHADPCECGRLDPETGLPYRRQNCCHKRDPNGDPWNKHMLKSIYLLQKCSNHVALVFPDPDDANSKEPDRVERYRRQLSYVQIMFPDSWQTKRCNASNGMSPEFCGKWKVLEGLLSQWYADRDKVLLFSTNLRLLQFIEFFISKQGYHFCRLDGSIPQHKRQMLVNQFNQDPSVFIFLISTTAGGTGLNLTAANRVVLFDPHWNPSNDLQAMDRAYRFGQTRDVYVYRLIGAGSLEECVYGRQLYKQQQMEIGYNATKERRYFEGVAGDQDNLGELFGCKNLFTLHESSIATRTIIDECNVAEVTFALQQYLDKDRLSDPHAADKALIELANVEGDSQLSTKTERIEGRSSGTDLPEDPVKAILNNSGVSYLHDHSELTGESRVEALLYRKAQKSTAQAGNRNAASSSSAGSLRKRLKRNDTTVAPVPWPPPRPKLGDADGAPCPTCPGPFVHIHGKEASKGCSQAERDPTSRSEERTDNSFEKEVPPQSLSKLASRALRHDPSDTLQSIARMEGKSEAQLGAEIRMMTTKEQTIFFDQAMQRLEQRPYDSASTTPF